MSFRQFGGKKYASKHNIVSSHYNTSNSLQVTENIGQPHSYITFLSDISGNMTLYGNFDLTGNLTVNGDETILGNLTVDGDETIVGNLTVDGSETIENNLTVNGDETISGNLTVDGSETILGNLTVNGDETISGNLTVDGNKIISGDVTIYGNETISGNLTVDGSETIVGNLTVKNIILSGDTLPTPIYSTPSDGYSYYMFTTSTDISFHVSDISIHYIVVGSGGSGGRGGNGGVDVNGESYSGGGGSGGGGGVILQGTFVSSNKNSFTITISPNDPTGKTTITNHHDITISAENGMNGNSGQSNYDGGASVGNGGYGGGKNTANYNGGKGEASQEITFLDQTCYWGCGGGGGGCGNTPPTDIPVGYNGGSGGQGGQGGEASQGDTEGGGGGGGGGGTNGINGDTNAGTSGGAGGKGGGIINTYSYGNGGGGGGGGTVTASGNSGEGGIGGRGSQGVVILYFVTNLSNSNIYGDLNVYGKVSANAFITLSDYRIKENIQLLNESYTVDKLIPVAYTNTQIHKEDIGFLAHEVQEVYPCLVTGEKDGSQLQTINYTGLIPILVKEIQELKKEIQELKENRTKK